MNKNSKNKNLLVNLKSFVKYLKGDIALLSLCIVSCVIYAISIISVPFFVGKAIDAMIHSTTSDMLYKNVSIILIIMSIIVALAIAFNYLFELSVGKLTYKIGYKLRKEIFNKYTKVSIKTIDSSLMGDLLQLNVLDVENVLNGLMSSLKQFLQGIITIICTIIFMFVINYLVAFVVVLLTPISFFVSRFVAKKASKYFKKQAKDSSLVISHSLEVIENLRLIQSLNYQDDAYFKFEELTENLYNSGQKAQFASSWVNPSTRLVNNIIYAVVGVVSIILLVFTPKIGIVVSVGSISSFLSYTMQYTKPFNEISSVMAEIGVANVAYSRIDKFISQENDVDSGKIVFNDKIEDIEFKNVCFSYSSDRKLIDNFSIKIKRGSKVAIVGPTGCGKTTMINLLMRFYDPNSGEILINGIKTTDMTKESFRNHFGMVLQDSWIFDGTVYENVSYSKLDSSKEEVINACKNSNSHSYIMSMSKDYDTQINAKSGLSEGEKQLITISRVMLQEPEVVILDEATSSVDTRTEIKISQAFDKIIKNKTAFVIAHRLSTIVNADLILVMKDGNIIETGNHKSLLEQKGFYYKLYHSQFEN